jgi:hypothetical protein
MDPSANAEAAALLQFLARGHKIKIFPGSHLPANAQYQICTNHTESVCSQCGGPVFFADNHPNLVKICIPCYLKFAQTHGVETIGTMDSLSKASLVPRRN